MAAFQPLRKQIVLRYDAAPLRNGRKRVLPRSNPTPPPGAKPLPNDKNIQHYPIPNSPLVIRIWDGGMEQYGQYCLDFFDPVNDIAVNGPDDYKIWHNPYPGQLTYGEQLVSWEAAMHVTTVPAGEERYGVQEGSWLVLTRSNAIPLGFQIPCRRRSMVRMDFAEPHAAIP
ncbi:hypothetical protein F5J12DRAFT_816085 [Pisolithus orientalis]|uniref:uncharacterized protein n=1 Tax=Pisolithus orientalis TaxID=936130 RepID=UPI002224881F|nr:uncharacterized protein F5J12DRAFT_816085 [Pisolithus orientalis]KAI6015126.1 hypothetical protein F5J12DRAFT_816085 [Pisolithus orientalis]